MDLNENIVFIRVVQAGSFSQAARDLGMPVSTVSGKVASLEKRLGVTLIQRTTRKLSITPIGQNYFKRSLAGWEEFKAAEHEVAAAHAEPQGLLRITAPLEMGSNVLPTIVSSFLRKYPKTKLDAILTQRTVDFLKEEIDVALRVGQLKDSSLIAKKVGAFYFAPFASPKYLKKYGYPKNVKEISAHNCIRFSFYPTDEWQLNNGKEKTTVSPKYKVTVNDMDMLRSMTLEGEGIALMPNFCVYNDVKEKKLHRLLPGWVSKVTPVYLVYPAQKFVTPNLRAFVKMSSDALPDIFRKFEF